MDEELHQLCKEVYKLTGWNHTEFMWVAPPLNDTDYKIMHKSELHELNDYIKHPETIDKMCNSTFCYDTDYLLEKLPRYLRLQRDDMDYPQKFAFKLRASTKDTNNWRAGYYNTPKKQVFQNLSIDCHADTPLKALLKLTIALSEAGELGNE